jgi:hypothetical protein
MKKEKQNPANWPTLDARLKNPIKTRKKAVEQLIQAGIQPTQLALRYLK